MPIFSKHAISRDVFSLVLGWKRPRFAYFLRLLVFLWKRNYPTTLSETHVLAAAVCAERACINKNKASLDFLAPCASRLLKFFFSRTPLMSRRVVFAPLKRDEKENIQRVYEKNVVSLDYKYRMSNIQLCYTHVNTCQFYKSS